MWNRLPQFNPTNYQSGTFTILRIAIGWHFFWEGWVKLSQPHWSAAGYLQASWGPLAPMFHAMADPSPNFAWILPAIDFAIPCALFLAGLGLMLGLFSRVSMVIAVGLLLTFIAAMPPFEFSPVREGLEWQAYFTDLGSAQWAGKSAPGSEGNYFAINKNLIELLALAALFTVNTKKLFGLDAWLSQIKSVEWVTSYRPTGKTVTTD